MTEWRSVTVAQLQQAGVLLVEDGNHGEYRPRPHEFVAGGTLFIRAADLADGRIDFARAGGIDDFALARIRKGIGQPGDILFSHKGTVGKLARVPMDAPPFVCSPQTTFWRVLDESQLRRDYLYAFMRSRAFIDQWWARKGETDMADYVSLTAQRQLRLTVPPLAVQCRIAKPLDALDDLIENNRRRIEVLEQMAQGIYREWFVHFRYPGHEDAVLVDSPLGPIPEGWQVKPLRDLIDVDKGLSYKGAHLTETGTPMANLKCFRPGGGFRRAGTKPYSGPFKPKHEIVPGDLIVANTDLTQAGAVIGSPAVVPRRGFETGGIISHHLFAIRCAEPATLPWLYQVFGEDRFRDYARGVASGTTVLGFRPADLLSYQVVCPPRDQYKSFNELARKIFQLAEDLTDGAEQLATIRDLLLPKLVTGQIDVSKLELDALVEPVT